MLRSTRWIVCLFTILIITLTLFHSSESFHQPALEYYNYYLSSAPSFPQSCPSVYDIGRPPLDHEEQKCTQLQSRIPEFDAEICIAPGTCNEFTIHIWRVDQTECYNSEAVPDPSFIPEISQWMRTQRGPDSFYVRTDGAERYSNVLGKYEGNCSYVYDIRVKNPGDILLQTWWTEKYEGFSETGDTWPEMHLLPLFDPLTLKGCSPECVAKSDVIPSMSRKVTVIPAPPTSWKDALPACDSSDPIQGSYIPLHPLDRLYPLHTNPEPQGVPVVGRYGFVPESCVWRHAGMRFGDHTVCTQKKRKIFFMGDSHGRVVYDGMVHRLSGKSDVMTESEKVGNKFANAGNLDLEFLWDPKGSEFIGNPDRCHKLGNADVVVTSLGSHWANSNVSDYLNEVPFIMNLLAECPYVPAPDAPSRSFIFLTMPAGPQRQDEWVQRIKDRRTNIRSAYETDAGLKIAKSLGWSAVDYYSLTLPFSMEALSVDMAHYLNNDALDPVVDEVIGKSGLCG
ncbi:hypothetical protein BT96DRAFT_911943 [Gymnopus androsaceus JB14]|uniref:SGNH domain-containing protein n=1 Tax=Gymnopus androsaceus JB14 TaxID=1447944 RepID=A0A6A4IRR8_9AGAR|nr:hypothetical protein BT96DRAFT_911943 [Gymnopus androsaceus JB14]